DVACGYERDRFDERLERLAVVLVPRHRQRAHRPAAERVFDGDVAGALRVALRIPVAARELETAFDGFRAAVGEEDAREAGDLRQARRRLTLQRVVVEV